MSSVPVKFAAPHYSTRLCRAQFNYVSQNYGSDLFESICESIGMPLDFVLRDDNWVSNTFFTEFIEQLKLRTGDPHISEKMGGFTVSPEAMNPIEYFINQSLFPELLYLGIPHQYQRFNNLNSVKTKMRGFGSFRYFISPKGKTICHPDVCLNTIGILEASKNLFSLKSVVVKHPTCIHHGANECIFDVRYSAGSFWARRLTFLSAFLFIPLLGTEIFSYFSEYTNAFYSQHLGLLGILWFFMGIAGFLGIRYFGIIRYIKQYNVQSKQKAQELYENYQKLERKFHESNLLRALSLKLSQTSKPDDVLDACLNEMHARFGFARSFVMLLSADKNRLFTAAVRGFDHDADKIHQMSLKYPAEKNEDLLFANILTSGEARIIHDIAVYKPKLKPHNQAIIEALAVNSIIVAPIQDGSEKFGLLVVGSIEDDRRLTEEDLHLITNICQMLTLSFQAAKNYDNEKSLRTLFQKYVPALVLDNVKTAGVGLAPKTIPITSLIVDLRNFTSRCENLPPEKTVELLNLYTSYVTSHISSAGGIIDKLVGDGVVAFFPGSLESSLHAEEAMLCTARLLVDLPILQEQFTSRGFGEVALGIGVSSGTATVGNMGCDRKLDYTAVGDTVNLAARLQEMSKRLRDEFPAAQRGIAVVSGRTGALLRNRNWSGTFENIVVRGRATPEKVHVLDPLTAQKWLEPIKVAA